MLHSLMDEKINVTFPYGCSILISHSLTSAVQRLMWHSLKGIVQKRVAFPYRHYEQTDITPFTDVKVDITFLMGVMPKQIL